MKLIPGLSRVASLDIEATRRSAEESGFATFILPLEGILDKGTFIDAIKTTLPLDPPLVGRSSWDALSDSLWEGLLSHEANKIALLWANTNQMQLNDFEIALGILSDIANTLSEYKLDFGAPKMISFLVEER